MPSKLLESPSKKPTKNHLDTSKLGVVQTYVNGAEYWRGRLQFDYAEVLEQFAANALLKENSENLLAACMAAESATRNQPGYERVNAQLREAIDAATVLPSPRKEDDAEGSAEASD